MADNMGSHQAARRDPAQRDQKAVDPVCGMQVMRGGQYRSDYQGTTYEFCSLDCKQQFDRDPDRYAMLDQADRAGGDEMRPP